LETRVADALHTPGVVSAQDGRLDDAGLIACHGAGMDVRTGVLYGPGTTALITGTADTAPMAVLVAAHHAVTRRQVSEGVYRGATEAPVRVPIDAAPAADSRIDVVWVKQNDASAGVLNPDGTTEWLVSKTTGTVAVSPTKPAIPTGAEELGTVTVAAGATATNGAGVTISNTARQTVARNARIPVRDQADRDSLTRFAGLEVYRLDTGQVQLCPSASGTDWLTVYDPALPHGPAASGRVPVAVTGLVGADTALTGVITVPAVSVPCRVVFTATGRTGNAASARTTAWDWDSTPGSATNVAKDDPAVRITAAGSQYASISSTLTMDLPAGVSATARLMYRSSSNGFNDGAVVWTRGPIV
jgi:hypothetical protein